MLRNLAQTTSSATKEKAANVPNPQSVHAINAFAIADGIDPLTNSIRNHLRMFKIIGGDVDYSRKQYNFRRRRHFLDRLVFMLVPRIGTRNAHSTYLGLVDERQNGPELDIIDVGAIPVSETYMQPDSISGYICHRDVDCFHVQFNSIEKLAHRPVLEHQLAFHGQVRRIQL